MHTKYMDLFKMISAPEKYYDYGRTEVLMTTLGMKPHTKEAIKQADGKVARWSHGRTYASRLEYLHKAVEVAKDNKLNLVELGCGYSVLAFLCEARGVAYSGYDINPHRVKETNKMLKRIGSKKTVDIKDFSTDNVPFVRDALYYMYTPFNKDVMEKAVKSIRKNSLIFYVSGIEDNDEFMRTTEALTKVISIGYSITIYKRA